MTFSRLRRSAPAITCASPCYWPRRLETFTSFRREPCGYAHAPQSARRATARWSAEVVEPPSTDCQSFVSRTFERSRAWDEIAPGRTRTCDPRLRRPVLYPTELRAHVKGSVSVASLSRHRADRCCERACALSVAGLQRSWPSGSSWLRFPLPTCCKCVLSPDVPTSADGYRPPKQIEAFPQARYTAGIFRMLELRV